MGTPVGSQPAPEAHPARRCGPFQPVFEILALFGVANDRQRIYGECGIPDPCVAVIPVTLAADGLW